VNYEQLISKLVNERIKQDLQQQEVAARLGVKKQNLNNWEKLRSRPKLEVFAAWCQALGMELLLEITDDPDLVQAHRLGQLLGGLPEDRQKWVIRFAELAYTVTDGDFRMLRAMLRELESDAAHSSNVNEGTSRSA
jgi:transcriptional regulator with XRE-family HTH domain